MVNQVPVVAILLIIEGILECLAGLFVAAMGPMMFTMMSQVPQQPGMQQPPKEVVGIMGAVYVVLGVVVLCVGILRIVAGIRNLKYRGRVLAIVALAAGILPSLTCWCLPTSLGLLIYGLIVYLNSDVARAFAMADQGMTPDQIKASFNRPGGPVAPSVPGPMS
jgi:uncharacterized membrane protein HdeD (DUF308 family)